MKRFCKRVWAVAASVGMILSVLCAASLVGFRLLGYRCYTVISGSMEPSYSVGDLLYVKQVDKSSIKVGDPITFVMNEELDVATHRVVRIDADKQYFYTKGDANDIEDGAPVHFNNVIGVPQFSVPMLGYLAEFVHGAFGMYLLLGICVLVFFAAYIPDLILRHKKRKAYPRSSCRILRRL